MIIGVATVLLALYTFKLWRATVALVAEAAANAERQLRAYVGVSARDLTALPSVADRPRFTIDIKNYGQTPAHAVDVSFGYALTKFPHESGYVFPAEQPRVAFGFILEPGQEKRAHTLLSGALSPAEAEAVKAGRAAVHGEVRLCVSGRIIYADVFGKSRTRRFCCFFAGDAGTTADYCLQHNTSD